MNEHSYFFADADLDREYARLQTQARLYDKLSIGIIETLGLADDAVCLEIGPGAGSMLRWMADRRPRGRVVGLDRDDRFFPASRRPNVDLRKADVRTAEPSAAAWVYRRP